MAVPKVGLGVGPKVELPASLGGGQIDPGREAVPQGVRRHALGDPRRLRCGVDGAHQLAGRHRVDRVLAGKQPGLRPRRVLPLAQQFDQLRRQHDIAISLPLALLDPKRHALAVDVGHLQRHDLGHPQARAVGDAERGLFRLGRSAPPAIFSARSASAMRFALTVPQ